MRALPLLLALLAVPTFGQEAASFPTPPFYGTVGSVGKVYGGPGDRFYAFRDLAVGEVVRVLDVRDGWMHIAPPGDLTVVIASRLGDRALLEEQMDSPEWIVKANDLQLRGRIPPDGDPNRDFPPLGELSAGDRVVGLEQLQGRWMRIAAPVHTAAWVLASHVQPGSRSALEAQFQNTWRGLRREVISGGRASGAKLARNQARKEASSRADALFARFEEARTLPTAERDLNALREEMSATSKALPEGDPVRARIEALGKELDAWAGQQAKLAAMQKKLDAAAKEAREAEERYAERLAEARRNLEKGTGPERTPEMRTGWVRKRAKIRGISKPGPDWYLEFGGRSRALLESTRYDLSEFEGVMVKVVSTDSPPRRRPGDSVDTLRVKRFEILETPRTR